MILRVSKLLLFSLLTISAFSQHRLSGKVFSSEDSTSVRDCMVHLDEGKKATFVDEDGTFVFEDVSSGRHTLHFTGSDFQYLKLDVDVPARSERITVYVTPRREVLSEVTVTDQKTDFGMARLRGVENMGIYEGRKSEVIIPEQLVANVSANNARQVYSRIAGLNIWDNDGGGIQLSIGGRGLDPNRSSNFNTRQGGYDISADALGYPESYYTPPVEGVGKIQIVRGASSLQYGTQFGGLVNFVMKSPVENKKIQLVARQTVGSFGFYNAFTSTAGTIGKFSYYSFFQYKRGDGWRKNSGFDNRTFYGNINYSFNENTRLKADFTHMDYLAQQPGGLTDNQFERDPRQTNRERNWFKVNWNLYSVHFDHKFNSSTEFNLRLFGLSASRYSVGFRPSRVETADGPEEYAERDLIRGDFSNWGTEARFLKRYSIRKTNSVLLAGARYYEGFNHSVQGLGSKEKNADFNFIQDQYAIQNDFRFPNKNVALFAENIIYISDKLSLTPGIRFENIRTTAKGYYWEIAKDLAGNIIDADLNEEDRHSGRNIFLAGLGVSYKIHDRAELYGNVSQNYRSITFNDMRIVNESSRIDPNLQDETGYSIDLGIRSDGTNNYTYDVSMFVMNYNNRIGELLTPNEKNVPIKYRTNVGQAIIAGIEAYAESDLMKTFQPSVKNWSSVLFVNTAIIKSEYARSDLGNIEGNEVEFVPAVNLKTGLRVGYKKLKASFQLTYLSDQFSDARNDLEGGPTAVTGVIPAYSVMDVSLSYEFNKFRIEGSINNVADQMYFTRRATGYPGPGILPADGRAFYLTLQAKLN
jgi:Fe(3+) dicitrate transport protein